MSGYYCHKWHLSETSLCLKDLDIAEKEVPYKHRLLHSFLEFGSQIHLIWSLFGGLNTQPISVANWLTLLCYEASHFHTLQAGWIPWIWSESFSECTHRNVNCWQCFFYFFKPTFIQNFEVTISNKRWFPWESMKFESLVLFELFVCRDPCGWNRK